MARLPTELADPVYGGFGRTPASCHLQPTLVGDLPVSSRHEWPLYSVMGFDTPSKVIGGEQDIRKRVRLLPFTFGYNSTLLQSD